MYQVNVKLCSVADQVLMHVTHDNTMHGRPGIPRLNFKSCPGGWHLRSALIDLELDLAPSQATTITNHIPNIPGKCDQAMHGLVASLGIISIMLDYILSMS